MLTGTPIQNKIEEVGSLLGILTHKTIFEPKSFKEHFVNPMKMSIKKGASKEAEALGEKRKHEFKNMLDNGYMLRRLKENELPQLSALGKKEIVVMCALTPLQNEIYQHILSAPDFDNVRFFNELCPCGNAMERGQCCTQYRIPLIVGTRDVDPRASVWRSMPSHANDEECKKCPTCVCLPCMQILAKVASHPSLLQVDNQDVNQAAKRDFLRYALTKEMVKAIGGEDFHANDLETCKIRLKGNKYYAYSIKSIPTFLFYTPYTLHTTWFKIIYSGKNSGKFKVLGELMKRFHSNGDKSLVFSNYIRVLDMIETFTKKSGFEYVRLDGTVAGSQRQGNLFI